jgi:hypothetical protein
MAFISGYFIQNARNKKYQSISVTPAAVEGILMLAPRPANPA